MHLKKEDKKITKMLAYYGLPALRYSLAIIFIWFGILKPLGLSPAQELVANTVYIVDSSWFVPFLGWWEVLIGVTFLYKPLLRIGLPLMALQMIGTFLPFIILPDVVFGNTWYALSLEGQYIIKNFVLIAAAMVVGAHIHDKT